MSQRNTALTLKQKLQIISVLQKKEKTKHQLVEEFKCDISTINRIMRNEANIRALAESNKSLELKRYRRSHHTGVEEALTVWYNQMRLNNATISRQILMNKAKEFAVKMNPDFEPTSGWLWRWQKRENIKFTKSLGESNEKYYCEGAQNLIKSENFSSILQDYSPENIYNADESGLLYKVLPNGEGDILKDNKSTKQRITLLFLCNSTATDKKIFAIGKFRKPRCLKGNNNLPVPYFFNHNAWMTNSIWMSILKQIDNEMINQNRKIVLFVTNAPCHKITSDLQNIDVQFLPANTTARIQPLDQGIVHSFKSHYRQILIRKQTVALGKGIQLQDFVKSISNLDVLYFIERAWGLVTQDTIINCFRRASFSTNEQWVDEVQETFNDVTAAPYNFQEYVACDENLQCFGLLTDDEIADEVMNNNDDDDDDLSKDDVMSVSEEPTVPKFKEALLAIDILRRYFGHRHDKVDEIENLETAIFENEFCNIQSQDNGIF